jgi:hypothetical protein
MGCSSLYEERHLLKVEFEDERKPAFGMFFGGAAFANTIRFCTTKIYGMGIKGTLSQLITLFLLFFSILFRSRSKGALGYSPELTLTFDGRENANTRFLALISTTLQKLIFGSKAPQVPGTFPFYTLRPSVFAMIASFFLAARGTIQNSRNRNIDLRFVKKVKIAGGEEFVLDGEIYVTGKTKTITLSAVGPVKFVSFNKV